MADNRGRLYIIDHLNNENAIYILDTLELYRQIESNDKLNKLTPHLIAAIGVRLWIWIICGLFAVTNSLIRLVPVYDI